MKERDWLILPGTSQWVLRRIDRGEADRLVADACRRLGIRRESLMMRCRRREFAWERQDIMHALRDRFGWSYPRIARYFSMDHKSVMHGVSRAKARRLSTSSQPVEIKGCEFDDEYVEFLHDMVKLEGAQLMESA